MAIDVSNKEFLEAVFEKEWTRAGVASGERTWWIRPAEKVVEKLDTLAPNYFVVSLFHRGPKGIFVRRKEQFEEQKVLVVDDVGTKLDKDVLEFISPPPSYILETSPGNFQWGYLLRNARDPRKLAAVIDEIIGNKEVNPSLKDPGMVGVTRVVRLPKGANHKDKVKAGNKGRPWPHVMHRWEPGLRYTVDELGRAFGADLTEDAIEKWADRTGKYRRATEAEIAGDQIMALFVQKDMVIDATPNDKGFISIRCPWAAEHSDARDEAGYKPGGGGFQCFHGHCESRTMEDVRAWIAENVTPEEVGNVAAQIFDDVAENDNSIAEAELPDDLKDFLGEQKKKADEKRQSFDRFCYVKSIERIAEIDTGELHTRQGFNTTSGLAPAGASGLKSALAVFINEGGRQVNTIDYAPGKPEFFRNHEGLIAYNTYRPSLIEPYPFEVSEDDVAPWLEHVKLVLPDETARRLFLDWAAYQVQKPGNKVNWAYVLVGKQGIGKDRMLFPVTEILGSRNVANIKARHIEDPWTDWLEAQVVVLEELPPHHKKDLYEHLKSLVSTAQKLVRVNKKNLQQYYIENRQNWFIFSNHLDALALEEDDRRYFVYESPLEAQPEQYYKALSKAFKKGEFLSKLASWLHRRDLSSFNPFASPPMTAAKASMIGLARAPEDAWIAEQFDEGGMWHGRQIIRSGELIEAAKGLSAFGGDLPAGVAAKVTNRKIAKMLRSKGFDALERQRVGEERAYLWVPKGQKWAFEKLSHIRVAEKYREDIAAWTARRDEEDAKQGPF